MVVCINRNVTFQLEVLICEKDGAKEKSCSRYCLYTDFLERVRERVYDGIFSSSKYGTLKRPENIEETDLERHMKWSPCCVTVWKITEIDIFFCF